MTENQTHGSSPFSSPDLGDSAGPVVGRARELAAAEALLAFPSTRLITLTGPAGIGKTRLARQVAATVASSYPDGVVAVPLASLSYPELLGPALARALGLLELGNQPTAAQLWANLRDRKLLLVLDGFDRLLQAAPLVGRLLDAAPGVKAIATSRAVLGLAGERELAVPPLGLPRSRGQSPELLARSPAVELFVQRARTARPGFRLSMQNAGAVAELCRRLDGLPLAIELAAARVSSLEPEDILSRLVDPTGRTSLGVLDDAAVEAPGGPPPLREAIGWSHDLLSKIEQQVFRRFAVFAGGASAGTARAVCLKVDRQIDDLEAALTSLARQSLLRTDGRSEAGPRFTMLETIQAFASEKLAESGEEMAMRRAHSDFFLQLAREAAPRLVGPEQQHWLQELSREHDNIRAALGWCLEQGETERALAFGAALWRFWYMRGHLGEGRAWLERLLMLPTRQDQAAARARALNGAGNLAYNQGDLAAAQSLHEEALEIWRTLGDRQGEAGSLNNLGLVAWARGENGVARGLIQEAVGINRSLGNRAWEAINLNNLGNIAQDQGELAGAIAFQEESLAQFSALEDEWGAAMALGDLAAVAADQNDLVAASAYGEASLRARRALGDRRGVARAVIVLGRVALDRGDLTVARAHLAEGLALSRDLGDRRGLAEALEAFSELAWAARQPERALRLAGAAAMIRTGISAPLPPARRARLELSLIGARSAVGAAADAVWASGQSLSLDQAVGEALSAASPSIPD